MTEEMEVEWWILSGNSLLEERESEEPKKLRNQEIAQFVKEEKA